MSYLQRISLRKAVVFGLKGRLQVVKGLNCSTQVMSPPTADGCERNYPPKITNIVDEISKLTLIEVVDLNELLKKTLNIKDTPMAMAAMPFAAAAQPAEEEEVAPVVTKTAFTIKLMKFDPTKKVAVIKEMKRLNEGMNLVQAKKFVEECPQIIKADIPKNEAEEIKKSVEALGGTCEIS